MDAQSRRMDDQSRRMDAQSRRMDDQPQRMDDQPRRLVLPSVEDMKQRLAHRLTPYSQPVQLACFSYDEQRQLHLQDRSQLKTFRPPAPDDRWNLWTGIESFVAKSEEAVHEHLDALLSTALACRVEVEKYDLVTWRGVMTKILCAPYASAKDDNWKMYGNYHKGVIYLVEAKEAKAVYHGKLHRLAVYGGFKFEQLCMLPSDLSSTRADEHRRGTVNANCEFGIVFSATLGPHKLLLGAEVDGLDAHGTEYIELKTARLPAGGMQSLFRDRKLLKWWLQSFLAAVPTIAVGFRDDRGNLDCIRTLPVAEIPRRARAVAEWDPQVVLCFGEMFFTWLKQMLALEYVSDDDDDNHNNDDVLCFSLSFDPTLATRSILLSTGSEEGEDVPMFIDKMVNKVG